MNNPLTFYCNLPLDDLDDLHQTFLRYLTDESRYVIAHEISTVKKISHFHVIAEMTNDKWEQFRNSYLMKKKNLLAKNKQFGKVKKINDINKMISYCIKDDGERRTNIPLDQIQDYLSKSYRKSEERDHIQLCIESIVPLEYKYSYSDTDILIKKVQIIEYFQKNNLEINYNKCNRIFDMWLLKQKISPAQIYDVMRLVRQKTL